jgi:hypothetical protein
VSDRSRTPRNQNELFNKLNRRLIDLRVAAQSEPDNKAVVREAFDCLNEIGYSQADAGKVISAMTKRRKRGRPVQMQGLYLEAFTLMSESKCMTLGRAIETLYKTMRLCDCRETHTDPCLRAFNTSRREVRQQFQTGIRGIKKRLREHEGGRQLVAQYDALHPNRDHKHTNESMER